MSENLTQEPQNAQKSSVKFILTMTLVGVCAAVALVSMYFPKMLNWYLDPTMPVGISCIPTVRWAIDKLQMAQVYALIVGAVIGMFIGIKLKRR